MSREGSRDPGTLATALFVARKELREAVRDRQTWIYTLLVPIALYPVLFWVMLQVFLVVQARDVRTAVEVAVAGAPAGVDPARLEKALTTPPPEEGDAQEDATSSATAPDEGSGEVAADAGPRDPVVLRHLPPTDDPSTLEHLLVDPGSGRAPRGAPDAVLVFPPDGSDATLLSVSTRSASRLAAGRVEDRLAALGKELRSGAVAAQGVAPETLAPFALESVDLGKAIDVGGRILSIILPLTFVVMAFLGAFFAAIDVTAGEKERGTAATTLLLPAPRVGVQLGKVLAVSTTSAVATGMNLLGMGLAAKPLLSRIPDARAAIQVPWLDFLRAAPLMLVFVLTTSAVLVAVASFATTFKQGQALLGPLQLVFMLPTVVAIMPTVQLTPALALVPIVQTALAFKALLAPGGLAGPGRELAFALALVSQLVYAAIVLRLSLLLSTREALATAGARLNRLGQLLRSSGTPR